jgi:hypothetical protein
VRTFLALVLAGVFVAASPCAAFAACAGASARASCCGHAPASCCCRAGRQQTPAPAPLVPSPRVAPDQASDLTSASGGGAGVQATAFLVHESALPDSASPPAFLTACAFRC